MCKNNKKIIAVICLIILIVCVGVGIFIFFINDQKNDEKEENINIPSNEPTIYLDTKVNLVELSGEKFLVNVKLENFPEDGFYPATSFSLDFDKTKLQFNGIRVGNITVSDKDNSPESIEIPTWLCNTELSNQSGNINAMYMDMSAQDRSYRIHNFDEEKSNILLRLEFTLMDSAFANDEITLEFKDVSLAALDDNGEDIGLSMNKDNLLVKNLVLTVE